MARTVRDAKLGTIEERLKQKANKWHWRGIHQGLALGYRRGKRGAGVWRVRALTNRAGMDPYQVETFGVADDYTPANGTDILSFEQAQRRAVAKADAWKRGAGTIKTALTVAEAIKRYVEGLRASGGDAKAKDAEQRLRLHVLREDEEGKPLLGPRGLGNRAVADLTLTELRNWRDELVTRKKDAVSRSTANRVMANFKAALNAAYADEQNGILSDRAWKVLEAFEGADHSRQDHFEAGDVQKLIDEARKVDAPFADLLTAGFLTGARYGELTACDVRHFDAERGMLAIPSGKTGARPVTLTADAIEFFKTIVKGRDRTAPLFPRKDGGRWGKSEQHRRIKAALAAAKLPDSASFYSLRHSYISRSIEEGVPVALIADNVGSSEGIIRKHYKHLIAEKVRPMLERAAKAFKLIHGERAA